MHDSNNITFTKKTISLWSLLDYTLAQGWRTFMMAHIQIVYKFRKFRQCVRGNFDLPKQGLGASHIYY
jgi:hypothetical protein